MCIKEAPRYKSAIYDSATNSVTATTPDGRRVVFQGTQYDLERRAKLLANAALFWAGVDTNQSQISSPSQVVRPAVKNRPARNEHRTAEEVLAAM